MDVALWSLGLYGLAVLVLTAAVLGLSALLGERRDRAASEPYESGIPPTGSARRRLPVHFYLVAVLFVIFDLEAAFLVIWAVAARELGWSGYAEVLVFVGVLLVAWLYLWRLGALDWWKGRGRSASAGGAP